MRPRHLLLPAATAALLATAPGSALAHRPADRDHDHMPDRWERIHHLNVHRNDAARDPDRDGVSNLAEFRAGTDPRNADTDGDGVADGAENAGTIASYTGGVLTIRDADGRTVSGRVTDATEIRCDTEREDDTAAPATARTARDGGEGDDTGGGDNGGSDGEDDAPAAGQAPACGPADLVAGAAVHEAKLVSTADGPVWQDVELEQ